nr:hypothetical protein CFP56_17778 [Quercus suber]
MAKEFQQIDEFWSGISRAHPALPKPVRPTRPSWKPPDPYELKTNFDGAIFDDLFAAARRAVIFIHELGIHSSNFEDDLEVSINALRHNNLLHSAVGHIVQDMLSYANSLQSFSFSQIFRQEVPVGKEDVAAKEDVGARGEKLGAIDEGRIKPLTTKLINELVMVDLAFVFVQHYASISTAFLSINPKIHSELPPTAPRTQVHPQHHDPMLI